MSTTYRPPTGGISDDLSELANPDDAAPEGVTVWPGLMRKRTGEVVYCHLAYDHVCGLPMAVIQAGEGGPWDLSMGGDYQPYIDALQPLTGVDTFKGYWNA